MSVIKPMFLIIDSETRRLLVEPAMHNVNCIFDRLIDAEEYQKNIRGEFKDKTEIVIKFPQFLNRFQVQQIEKAMREDAEKVKEPKK